jgi:hypothetical protein
MNEYLIRNHVMTKRLTKSMKQIEAAIDHPYMNLAFGSGTHFEIKRR